PRSGATMRVANGYALRLGHEAPQFGRVGWAETCALAVRLRQRVREPHHAAGIAAMAEAVGMAELMNGFGGGAAGKELAPGCFSFRTQPLEREHGHAAVRVSFAEDEIQLGDEQIDVGHAEQAVPARATRAGERVEQRRREVLPPAPII